MSKIKTLLSIFYHKILTVHKRILWTYLADEPLDFKDVPIIINNYNRLYCLKMLIDRLESDGYRNLYIIDNNSTYPPLLKYYESSKCTVFRLKENVGYLSLWKTGLYKKFKNQYYVYTDSDVIPAEDCPNDYVEYFFKIMKSYKNAHKVGFGLRIDNLPDCYKNKEEVIKWESQYYLNKLDVCLYKAAIDTTFALYRPYVHGPANFRVLHIRTGFPYVAEHLPWYQDSDNLTEEDLYYKKSIQTSTHWSNLK